MSKDTKEMPQSQNTTFSMLRKKRKINGKTNFTHDTTDARTKKWKRGTTLERLVGKLRGGGGGGGVRAGGGEKR